ncbi:hypothetical protein, partial [Croceitalea sp. MTPC5]|uniref:hypothetical protein n=1 Tax=Croceitalea sp. MTPC5 TaxID=3056565 RepID=UPI0030CF8208
PQTINKSDLTDNGNGTFTFDNGDGAPITFVGTDDQDATGVDFTATGNTTSTNVQDAIEEIQTELDGVDGTDDQDLGIGTNGVANESVEVTITDGAAALIDIRDGDADAANEINTAFAVVGTNLRITDSGGSLQVPLTSLGSDNQDLSHTILVPEEQVRIEITDGNNTTISIEDADADITNELTTSGTGAPSGAPANNNTGVTYVDTAAGQLYMWDGTTWNIVGGSATPGDASDTNELITSFSVTNDGTEDVLRITEAGSDFDVPLSNIGTDDQTATEVTVADAGDNFTTDTVEAALAELAGRTDNDTQYTAGNGLNLDGSNEFTAVASPDANNALDVRANGIYATDDQNAGEVTVADAGDNFTVDTVEAALAELAGRTDNDTQYTAGNGLNLDGSNEFTAVASPDANNALDVRANGIYATDDQDLGIGTNGVANESVEVTITNGTAALIDIRDGDSDDTN